jgi:DNA-binding MarR family transcriptional regulator
MKFSRKYKGSALFLKGAGHANQHSFGRHMQQKQQQQRQQQAWSVDEEDGFTDLDVLSLLARRPHVTVQEVAEGLDAAPEEVGASIDHLLSEGFVEPAPDQPHHSLRLTETGERALRYTKIAR